MQLKCLNMFIQPDIPGTSSLLYNLVQHLYMCIYFCINAETLLRYTQVLMET